MRNKNSSFEGLALGIGAFVIWGILPLYWDALHGFSSLELLMHRVLWSLIFTALGLTFRREWPQVASILKDRRSILKLMASSVIIGTNWLIYIWAILTGQVLECSLGYFIMPLASVALGAAVLKERPNAWQYASLVIIVTAVLASIVDFGHAPVIALALAITFASYGLIHKITPAKPLPAFFVETSLLGPPSIAGLALLHHHSGVNWGTVPLMATTGLVTSVPMLLFTAAVTRLNLTELGILQYINPSVQLLVGSLILREGFNRHQIIVFGLIWLALTLFWLGKVTDGKVDIARKRLLGTTAGKALME